MITDDLVKGFIFSAHYQMFQFSVPLISLVVLQWFQEHGVITWRILGLNEEIFESVPGMGAAFIAHFVLLWVKKDNYK